MNKLCILPILFLVFCSSTVRAGEQNYHHQHKQKIVKINKHVNNTVITGNASWYGYKHAGKLTSNGERFNPYALTCAHKTLPMNSLIKVTNLKTGAKVILRVNDRGPYIKHRILDVSDKAASLLGFRKDGLTKVKIEILSEGIG